MVKKLKARKTSDHKRGTIRQVQCGGCGWLVASPNLGALLGVGWEVAVEAGKVAFVCRTCAQEHPRRVCKGGDMETLFRSLPPAPINASPLVGGQGEEHADTSRPWDTVVKHLVVDNAASRA